MGLDFAAVNGVDEKPKTKAVAKKKTPMRPIDPLDIELAKKNLSVYEDKIKQMKREIDRFKITNDKTLAVCVAAVSKAAKLINTMETNRKNTIEAPDKFVRRVNAFVKVYRDQVQGIVKVGKQKIGAWDYEKEMKRREDEAKAKKEKEKLQEDINNRAKVGGFSPVTLPDIVVPKSTAPTRTEEGKSSTSMEWTWEVEDVTKVPREYLSVNENTVKAAVKAGIRNIDGIRIFEKPNVRITTT